MIATTKYPGLKRIGYTIGETAEIIGSDQITVKRMLDQGRLKCFRLAGSRPGKSGGIRVTAKSIQRLEEEAEQNE